MNLLCLTTRYSDGFFHKRLKEIFLAADPGVTLKMLPQDTNDQAAVKASDLIITESVDTRVDFQHGVFFPFNTNQVPMEWGVEQRNKIDYYIITAFFARKLTARYGLNVSTVIPSPLCWLPPFHNDDYRSLVLHFPKMRNWTDDDMAKFIMFTVDALSRDQKDLREYTIVAECSPFHYKSRQGERMVFVDDEGTFFWHLLKARILVSMANEETMEMVFVKEAAAAYDLPVILRSESMMHPSFEPQTMLGKMAQPRSYTDIKSGLVVQDWYFRAVSERTPFIDIGSGIENMDPRGKISFSMEEYRKVFGSPVPREGWENLLVQNQEANKALMIEKMTKLLSRVKAA